MEEKRKELGYSIDNSNMLSKVNNSINNVIDQSRMEKDIMKQTIIKNWKNLFNSIIKNMFTKKIEVSVEDTIKNFNFQKFNPYQDKKFAMFIAQMQSQKGLEQLNLDETLSSLTKSTDGQYLTQKYKDINEVITKKGIHGKDHSNRVMILSMMIAQKEGLLDNDIDDRIKDILITSSAFHDIGRIGNNGPHASRGSRKIKKMNLTYSNGKSYSLEDKNLVRALVEGHEGKPDKIYKLINKYNLNTPEYKELAIILNSVLRDADALDRVRIDKKHFGYKVNLNPWYLVNDSSKQLLNVSYELENLTKKVKSINSILNYKTSSNQYKIMNNRQRDFYNKYKYKEINIPLHYSNKLQEEQRQSLQEERDY